VVVARKPPAKRSKLITEPEFQGQRSEAINPLEHAKYMPPWRDKLPSGGLGPEHGPRSESELKRAQKRFCEALEGGGLWDPDQEAGQLQLPTRVRRANHIAQRYDARAMDEFVRKRSYEIPMSELEVYTALYVDGVSQAVAARRLGRARKTVHNQLLQLRRRLKAWL
jgi:hypothetical protein